MKITKKDKRVIEKWLRKSDQAKILRCPWDGRCEWNRYKCKIIFPNIDEYAKKKFPNKRLWCPCTIFGIKYVNKKIKEFIDEENNENEK